MTSRDFNIDDFEQELWDNAVVKAEKEMLKTRNLKYYRKK